MTLERLRAAIALASILLVSSCQQTQAPPPAPGPGPSKSGLQANAVQEFSFPGGTYKDGRVRVSSDCQVVKGDEKNVVTLQRANDSKVTISCWCTLEGGDCWALTTDLPDGRVDVSCVAADCASGQEPFCFQDIEQGSLGGFRIRLVVASR